MARIFISAQHGGIEGGRRDPGAIVGNTTEAAEMIQLRDLVVAELRSRNQPVLSVPDDLSLEQTLSWINARAQPGDAALEIAANAYGNPSVRGASVFYILNNVQRKSHAELVLLAYLRRIPQLPSRGAIPDTATATGSLAFCRRLSIPSLIMEVVVLTNPDDRAILQNRRRDLALGIADGLVALSRAVNNTTPTPPDVTYDAIDINVNGGIYGERGIIVNGNAYIPIDLVDRLGVNLADAPDVVRLTYRGVVYVKAIELRDFNISVSWDANTRTVTLRSAIGNCPGAFDRIMGFGNTSEVQLLIFLKSNNESAVTVFPDLPRLYREEGAIERVNHDIAFAQMCVETDFLRFGRDVLPTQNNFAGLGSAGGETVSASFPSARIGVRAHIQHLKAYASTEPLVQELVDPRFRFVTRGVAPLVGQLGGRWRADPNYGGSILAVLRRLYESAGLL
ncbi:MAG: cell wall hydrolase [Leptolyngbyaceae cyanobacterium SM1_3_5]|nr:cell wall hydrolase [Leptolyngbyaceae cyanobacterium SM1_3_5]